MVTAEIRLPEKDAEMIIKVISKLGGKVKLISPAKRDPLSSTARMKADLKEAFREVRLHQDGEIQLKTARDLLDEL